MGTEQNKKNSVVEMASSKRFAKSSPRDDIEQKLTLPPLVRSILEKRYPCTKENRTGETLAEMFRCVANVIAAAIEEAVNQKSKSVGIIYTLTGVLNAATCSEERMAAICAITAGIRVRIGT